MDKREFIKSASAAAILASLGFTINSCSSEQEPGPNSDSNEPFQFDLTSSEYSSLNTEGEWIFVRSERILLVNAGGTVMAFSSKCTHSGCSTSWSFGANAVCGCHGSTFDVNGDVVKGPAQKPLNRLAVSREGDTVTVG